MRFLHIGQIYFFGKNKIFLAVSNCGEKFEFFENPASDFCSRKQVINGYMTKKGFKIINISARVTALSKPLEHVETD